MAIKSILIHVDRDAHFASRLKVAVEEAARHRAHLIGLFSYGPPLVLGFGDTYVTEELVRRYRESLDAAAKEMQPAFERAAKAAGVAYEWRQEDDGSEMTMPKQARYVDLAVVGQTDPADPMAQRGFDFAEEVIMTSGAPVLTVPYAGTFKTVGQNVMIAWNGTREAARAVRDAMPFLTRAKSVLVYSVNPTDQSHIAGADIATQLARHDIKVEARHTVAHDIEVGDTVLSAASDNGIDLLVMGAYGHSRFRELVLGGATRHILHHMTVPTLFSH